MDAAAVERFSGPPLAERAHISDQARGCVVRPGAEDLESLVARDLASGDTASLAWDAWRRDDGRWTVVASVGASSPLSTWVFDPRSKSVQPDDAASHRLASQDVVVPLRSSSATLTVPRAEVQQGAQNDTDDEPASSADQTVATRAGEAPSKDEALDNAGPSSPSKAKSRKGRRASVPRWDEILFGAGQSDS